MAQRRDESVGERVPNVERIAGAVADAVRRGLNSALSPSGSHATEQGKLAVMLLSKVS